MIVFAGVFVLSVLMQYQMRIYENTRSSDYGAREIKRCYSFKSNFYCNHNSPTTGYYIKAVTHKSGVEISNSGWQLFS